MSRFLGPRKQVKIGTFTVSGGNLIYGDNDVSLQPLPIANVLSRIGLLEGLRYEMTETFATLASDPTVPSYMLDAFHNVKLFGADNNVSIDRLGFHEPIREYDSRGWLQDTPPCLDLPATGSGGAGSYPRTIVREISFLEPAFGDFDWMRMLPCAYWKQGFLRLQLSNAAKYLNGATVTVTAASVTLYAYIRDWLPTDSVPIGMNVQEKAKQLDQLDKPSPGRGQFMRWLLVRADPAGTGAVASQTPLDDLSSITRITVGPPGGPYRHERRFVDEFMAKYNEGIRDQRNLAKTALTFQEIYRFSDAVTNASGRLHYLPLIVPPRQGAGPKHLVDYGEKTAVELEINDGVRGGSVPTSFIHLLTTVENRSDGMVGAVLGALNLGAKFKGRQSDHQAWAGKADRVPLLVKL